MAEATWLAKLAPASAIRAERDGGHVRVTNMELFFDLVYVFSIIQLSHFLLAHQTWTGALQAATVFAAVWWAWNYTAWAANWLDPDHPAGRALMIVLMACALLMAVAMPYAFGLRAELFVGAYVAMALIRAGYAALVMRGQTMGRNYAQLCAWSAFSGLFWIAGALVPSLRLELWILAVLIDYAAPYAGFWLPGKGATAMESWTLKGLHLLERNQLVFIIALGESILLLGGTLVDGELGGATLLAAGLGFLTIVTLWWLYFVRTTEGEHAFEHEQNHTRLARAGLAYAHGIMVCGAIVVAVAIEEIIAHPDDPAHLPTILIAVTGPLIFLVGNALFRATMARRVPPVYLVSILGLFAVGYAVHALHASGLVLGTGVLAVLVLTTWLSSRRQET
ncbi:low temperature requirement protein A [Nitratireductor luteus]|uniref:low temperature requirement protein A n=1 Tax=Nitratireductor luteus TaxID=2976980 RepID=UPI00223EDAF2|nr:low temperature requirement protein A [Nitratireductor luteus]